jgi:hypothetical protein
MTTVFWVLAGILFAGPIAVDAISYHKGTQLHLAVLGSRLKFPIFTKEFAEGENVVTVGGVRELWFADQTETFGFRLEMDRIRSNGSGLGLGLTYWRTEFANASFLYDREGDWNRIAEYQAPQHQFFFLDVNGILIPWESKREALAFVVLIGLVGDYEEYRIDKYSNTSSDPTRVGLSSTDRSAFQTRFGFGFGARFHFMGRLSLWFEKRWIVGESFSTDHTFTEGGFFATGSRKTLYAPINSVALALTL